MPGLPEYLRVFAAIGLEEEIRVRLEREVRSRLAPLGRMSVPPQENLHVTLKFVGDVHREDLPALSDAVADAADLLSEGELTVAGVGAFPGLSRPRVLWAGVSDPEAILSPVHARLNESLAGFGAKREKKRYVPHVTLARVRGPLDTGLLREAVDDGDWSFGTQVVTGVTLYMSELRRGGPPRYSVLGHY